jgi:glycosyltransferase involved in cell wall biosynthesis
VRVIHVVGHFTPACCGVAHYTSRLVAALIDTGLDVTIVSRSGNLASSVPFYSLPTSAWSISALLSLLRLARGWHVDWLHLQYAPGSFDHRRRVCLLPFLAKLIPGAPQIAVTIHEFGGWPWSPPAPLAPFAERALAAGEQTGRFDRETLGLLGASDLTIVTNPDHFAQVRARSPRLASRLQIIPIGPNVSPELGLPTTREQARAALGISADRFVAIFFGFVHPVKGIETLLLAMHSLRKARPDALLWLVGGTESLALRGSEAQAYEEKICRMIGELGLADAVDLTGFLADHEVAMRLRAADLAVLPFNRGATLKSGTLITCLGFGLPVLTTAGGDLGDLRHAESTWLVPPRDSNALAKAMYQLASVEEVRQRIAAAGQTIGARYRWPMIAQQHRELYEATNRPVAVVTDG